MKHKKYIKNTKNVPFIIIWKYNINTGLISSQECVQQTKYIDVFVRNFKHNDTIGKWCIKYATCVT